MVLASLAVFAAAQTPLAPTSDYSFDDLFPRKRFTGKAATGLSWSADGRYLAYLWNPYEERGSDLYLLDSKTGKTVRVTSPELMKAFDRDIPKALERYRKEDEEETKRNALADLEYREAMQKLRKENDERKEPLPAYPGVSGVKWSNAGDQVLWVYRGDVYRWKVGDKTPTRMTRTREDERNPQFTSKDDGMVYQRGQGIFRVSFASAVVEQINPPLPGGMNLDDYNLSPDGTKIMLFGSKNTGAYRQVDMITYRDRFAQSRKVSQYWGFPDEKISEEHAMFLAETTDDPTDPKKDGKPWEVFKWTGGEDFWGTSVHDEPWSPDSNRFVFGMYKRNSRQLEIQVTDYAKRKVGTAYATQYDGEPSSLAFAQPFFLPDGQKVMATLENTGYRQPWVIDPTSTGAVPLTKGEYETWPLRVSPDGKSLVAYSGKEHPGRMNLYRVDLASGEMTRLTTRGGQYREDVAVSKDASKAATMYASWEQLPELTTIDLTRPGKEQFLTKSHRDGFMKLIKIKPEMFSFANRHGQTVHGFKIVPPGFQKTDKRPLMIYVYGGPLGRGRTIVDGAFGSTEVLFANYMAYAMGYVCIAVDPRGQSGYGAAFGKANYNQAGKAQVEDLVDAVNFMKAEGGIDPAKVGVNGWSFGGFQTQMCLFTAPETFTLGIAGAGPTEWQNYNSGYVENVIGLAPTGKPEELDKHSTTNVAKNLKGRLLLLHGVEDDNVLYQHTISVYRKLLQYGKGHLVELAIDPTGGHGMGGDMSNRDRHEIYLAFLMKHWGPYVAPAKG